MGTKHPTITHVKSAGINFIQINLQHAREATSNLMKVVAEEETDIISSKNHTLSKEKLLESQQFTTLSRQATFEVEQQ